MVLNSLPEQRRLRILLIAPEQFLRCVQLLAEGIVLRAEFFPPAVRIVSAYPASRNGEPVFAIVLEHATFDAVPVVNVDGVLVGQSSQIPPIFFTLDEQQTKATSSPIIRVDPSGPENADGMSVTHESHHLLNYQILPYHIIRIFSLLAAGAPTKMPAFPHGMTLLFSGQGSDGAFSIICEHPSFAPVEVDIQRNEGQITQIGGAIPLTRLTLEEDGMHDPWTGTLSQPDS